jgi:hypothetical protein
MANLQGTLSVNVTVDFGYLLCLFAESGCKCSTFMDGSICIFQIEKDGIKHSGDGLCWPVAIEHAIKAMRISMDSNAEADYQTDMVNCEAVGHAQKES